MMVTMLFMGTVIIDGIFFYFGKVSEWWFHVLYFLTVLYFFKATKEQHKSFKGSTEIVLEMTKGEREKVS